MARAKRTERAEARRRYRAEQLEAAEAAETEGTSPVTATAAPKAAAAARDPKQGPVPGQKYGFMDSFRMAYRPIRYREDLRYIPTLILRTNAIWPATLLVLIAAGLLATQKDTNSAGFQIAAAILGSGAPFIPAVIAGFLAPRAAWLAGFMVTLLAYFVPLLVFRDYLKGVEFNVSTVFVLIAYSFVYGAAFGSASAWYKRFLSYLMAPSAARGGGNARRQSSKTAGRSAKPAVAGRRRAS